MLQMINRFGAKTPKLFASADLTYSYFQMPLDAECRQATAFITFRGIYEFTKVP